MPKIAKKLYISVQLSTVSEIPFPPEHKIQYLIVQKFIIFGKKYLPVLNCTKLIFKLKVLKVSRQATGANAQLARRIIIIYSINFPD